jgi:parvulin-like peptidyl-prolyl isomerase
VFPRRILLVLLAFVIAIGACKRKPSIPPDVIARVNERMITLADFKRYLERNAGSDLAQLTPEVASAILDQYVEEIIISEHAAATGVEVPADQIAAAVRTEAGATVVEKRDEMRRERLLANIAAGIPEPSDAEVLAFYERNATQFQSAEEVRVRQILVHDEELANTIRQQLRAGASFGDLSSQHSLAPNAQRGGEIGFVSRGELPKMFEDEIFNLNEGEISEVIRTDSSFHLFQVDQKRAAGTLDPASAAPIIRSRMREEAIRQSMTDVLNRARRSMNVSVLTRRLPFRYSGGLPVADDE